MAEPTLEDRLKEAEELIRTYEEISQTEIPRTVQEARREGWKIIPRGIVIAGLVHYEDDERKADRQRVISLPVALKLIEDFEDGLLSKTVKNPKQIFVSKTRFMIGLFRHGLTAIGLLWDVLKATVDLWDILDLIAWLLRLGFIFDLFDPESRLRAFAETVYEIISRYSAFVIGAMLTAFAVPVFSATVLDVEKEREFWIARMRKAALPQRNQRRVWRRKVSRL